MTERLLLTGAGGFIGHHTLEHLLVNTDWQVVCTDSFRHGGKIDRIREVIEAGPPSWRGRVQVVMHDLTAPFTPQTISKLGRLDYIVAMASLSHVDDSLADPVPFVLNNTAVALSVLEFARRCGDLKAIILVSTDEVYGPAEVGHKEWASILPSNPYAASKAAQEAIAISYWRGFGLPLIITNTMNVIGERQDPVKYLPKTIRSVLHGETLTIHGREGDIGSRHYLHARNAADAWLWMLLNLPPNCYGKPSRMADRRRLGTLYRPGLPVPALPPVSRPDRYNVCGLERVDNLTLAQSVAAIVGKPLQYELVDFHSARPGHDPHYALDGAQMTGLGWKAPVPFAESLERTVRWTLARPDWLLD